MNPVEILGFFAGGIGIFVGLPQALQVRRLGHGHGVSVSSWTLMFTMYLSWGFYGIRISSPSSIFSNALTVIVISLVLFQLFPTVTFFWLAIIGIIGIDAIVILALPERIVSALLIASVFSQLPQVNKSFINYRLALSSAVSTRALELGIASAGLWMIYALIRGIHLIVLTCSITITISGLILIFEKLNQRESK